MVASLGKYVVTLDKLVGTLTNRACLLIQMKVFMTTRPLPYQNWDHEDQENITHCIRVLRLKGTVAHDFQLQIFFLNQFTSGL
jgi:hypothetical protein